KNQKTVPIRSRKIPEGQHSHRLVSVARFSIGDAPDIELEQVKPPRIALTFGVVLRPAVMQAAHRPCSFVRHRETSTRRGRSSPTAPRFLSKAESVSITPPASRRSALHPLAGLWT